jgi:tetratricopeptide (TPR) repeat protein
LLLAIPCTAISCSATPSSAISSSAISNSARTPLADAERLVLQGNLNAAVPRLQSMISANPQDGAAHLLLCRAFYSEELANEAAAECDAALVSLGQSAEAQDWAGRAFGIKADHAGLLAGYKLAGRVKDAFEKAVRLDPNSPAAANDLGEYYVNAPTIVGGGVDKATALADRIAARLPQVAFRLRAMVAEKQHDYGTAERDFIAATDVAGRSDAWADLGNFYFRRGQHAQAINALQRAIGADTAHGPILVDIASVLIDGKTALDLARKILQEYLASNAKSDSAPAFKAYVQLGRGMAAGGDVQGAQAQYRSALALAHDYQQAIKALQQH